MATTNVVLLSTQQILNREVNVYGDFENPLFLAKDVAEWIDYAKTSKGAYNVSMMLQTVDDDEKLVSTMLVSGQNREVLMLTEIELYADELHPDDDILFDHRDLLFKINK